MQQIMLYIYIYMSLFWGEGQVDFVYQSSFGMKKAGVLVGRNVA